MQSVSVPVSSSVATKPISREKRKRKLHHIHSTMEWKMGILSHPEATIVAASISQKYEKEMECILYKWAKVKCITNIIIITINNTYLKEYFPALYNDCEYIWNNKWSVKLTSKLVWTLFNWRFWGGNLNNNHSQLKTIYAMV